MATLYWSSAASGGGDGSFGDPFTLTEAIDDANAETGGGNDYIGLDDGTYSRTATDTISVNCPVDNPHRFIGADSSGNPTIVELNPNGSLDETDMPLLSYSSGNGLSVTGNSNLIIGLQVEGDRSSALVSMNGNGSEATGLKVTNASTNANGVALQVSGHSSRACCCDLYQTGASGGAAAGVISGAHTNFIDCRATSTSGSAFYTAYNFGASTFTRCIGYGSGEHGLAVVTTNANGTVLVEGCTFYDNDGNAIDVSSSNIAVTKVKDSYLSGNGGYAADDNGASGLISLDNVRAHDNASGNWNLSTRALEVAIRLDETDSGAADQDFVDAAGLDFRLKPGSAAIHQTARGISIGASDPKPGGGARSYAFA